MPAMLSLDLLKDYSVTLSDSRLVTSDLWMDSEVGEQVGREGVE